MDLSLVMSIGNDDYGNHIYRDVEPAVPTPERQRTEYCLFTLREAFKDIDYELIIVEWLGNQEGEKPSDWEFIKDDRTRIIRVPYEFAHSVCPERPFHETHAKNIGIRRAKSEMIMGLNNDCLWLDEFPKELLLCTQDVITADRPTVYHTVMDAGLDIEDLWEFCIRVKNQVHQHDYHANGDFTLMHRDTWSALRGLSTPKGDCLAGLDMQAVTRAEQFLRRGRLIYRYPIFHIRHPGAPLESNFNIVTVSPDWGFPNTEFEEI